jgi:nicotinate-nucleotide adenylyltransferase
MLPDDINPRAGRALDGLTIGLLGGSFNPAHEGHLAISREAFSRLGLDRLWWLVSPGNPLKSGQFMLPMEARVAAARAVAGVDRRITVTGIEAVLGTRYTADTLEALARHFPRVRFIWLMGADNLAQMPRWARWESIFASTRVAVMARAPYTIGALGGKAARRFARSRLAASKASLLAKQPMPAWVFLPIPLHPASATAIRAGWSPATGGSG